MFNKRITKTLIIFLSLICLVLTGCGETIDKEDNKEEVKPKYYITFENENISVNVGSKEEIIYDTNFDSEIEFYSDDERIAYYIDDYVRGVKEGFTTISATFEVEGVVYTQSINITVLPRDIKTYTVTIDGKDYKLAIGNKISDLLEEIYDGDTYEIRDGYIFDGWFSDERCTKEFNIKQNVSSDVVIYSKYHTTSDHLGVPMTIYTKFNLTDGEKIESVGDTFTISPVFDGNLSDYDFSNYYLVECTYNVSKDDYEVTKVNLNTNVKISDVPYNGFIVGIKKSYDKYEEYKNRLSLNTLVYLNKYSINKVTRLYFDRQMDTKNINTVKVANISAEFSYMYDLTYKTELYSKNALSKAYPASTTKIITALTALRYCPLETTHVVGNEYNLTFDHTSSPSLAGTTPGSEWTLRQLLYGLMLPSGNDAAYVIAALTIDYIEPNNTYEAREKCDKFADLMNETAALVGCENSHFMVPDGNDYYEDEACTIWEERLTNHYTCAKDMIRFAKLAFACGAIAETCGSTYKQVILKNGISKSFSNTNCFISKSNEWYYQGAVGLKTGTTEGALYCLIAGVEIDGRFVLCSILKASTSPGRYADAKTLYDIVFRK